MGKYQEGLRPWGPETIFPEDSNNINFGLFVKFQRFFPFHRKCSYHKIYHKFCGCILWKKPQNFVVAFCGIPQNFVAYHLDVDRPNNNNRSSGHPRDCLHISGLPLYFRNPLELFVSRSIFVYLLKMSNPAQHLVCQP